MSSGYICAFQSLEVKSLALDALMTNPSTPTREQFSSTEIKSLRDTRQLLERVSITDAYTFIEQNSHVRLWSLLAEAVRAKQLCSWAADSRPRCGCVELQLTPAVLDLLPRLCPSWILRWPTRPLCAVRTILVSSL